VKRLAETYQRRLSEDLPFRNEMYRVLCSEIFQKYVPQNSIVLDLAAGYCEFINHIQAKRKIAIDLNPDVAKFSNSDVEVFNCPSTDLTEIPNSTVDLVFTSNFLEHLTRDEIQQTIQEVWRVLDANGAFLILQPNIRYCSRDYWMFFDHLTPLDDRSLSEALEINGFHVAECRPKFLPFTTKSRLPKSIFLLKMYLKFPPAQWLLGAQALIYAKKVSGTI